MTGSLGTGEKVAVTLVATPTDRARRGDRLNCVVESVAANDHAVSDSVVATTKVE